MDDHRTPPPTPSELLRLVEARIITVDEARSFLFPDTSHVTFPFPHDELRRSNGRHAGNRHVL